MTDKEKLEKIKALADKMYSRMAYLTSDTRPIRQAMDDYHQFIINEYHKEEPVSEELEQAAKNYSAENVSYWYDDEECVETYNDAEKLEQTFKAGAKWQKAKDESTTEDLGEYINELSKQFPEVSFAKLSRIAVRVAKWQKQQDQSTIELAEDHAYFAGRTKTMDETKEALLSEVLPCFMHGGEADEVVAKLDEVLNQKK